MKVRTDSKLSGIDMNKNQAPEDSGAFFRRFYMSKDKKSAYFCQNCGYESAKWMGQCPSCHQWNTFVEELVSTKKSGTRSTGLSSAGNSERLKPKSLSEIDVSSGQRTRTDIGEMDLSLIHI